MNMILNRQFDAAAPFAYAQTRGLIAAFEGWERGNLARLLLYPPHSDPRRDGKQLYSLVAQAITARTGEDPEIDLVRQLIRDLPDEVRATENLLELGPGIASNVADKTTLLGKAMRPRRYAAVDVNAQFAAEACAVMQCQFRLRSARCVADDIFRPRKRLRWKGRRLVFSAGMTFANLPVIATDRLPVAAFVTHLENWAWLAGTGGYLCVTLDGETNADLALAPYRSSATLTFMAGAAHRIAALCDGARPEWFAYEPIFHRGSGMVEHALIATRSMRFTILGDWRPYRLLPRGSHISILPSYKLPFARMQELAELAGLHVVAMVEHDHRYIVLLRVGEVRR